MVITYSIENSTKENLTVTTEPFFYYIEIKPNELFKISIESTYEFKQEDIHLSYGLNILSIVFDNIDIQYKLTFFIDGKKVDHLTIH